MTERDALLAAVLAEPDDDGPRLVFADWLDDHGEPERAELIRLQIDRVRRSFPRDEFSTRWEREERLLRAHEMAWVGPIANLVQGARFRRGFVERGIPVAQQR